VNVKLHGHFTLWNIILVKNPQLLSVVTLSKKVMASTTPTKPAFSKFKFPFTLPSSGVEEASKEKAATTKQAQEQPLKERLILEEVNGPATRKRKHSSVLVELCKRKYTAQEATRRDSESRNSFSRS